MKIYYSNYFPPRGFAAINLFGIIIGRKEYGSLSKYELNHEKIHSRQIIEMLWVFFYLIYLLEWLFRLVQYRNRVAAYYNISFEREAYCNDKNLSYLKNRRWYAFLNYMYKKKGR